MPIGEYENFDACVAANRDKSDPEAYCASIEQQAKRATLTHIPGVVVKTIPEERLVFGWAYVAKRKDGTTVIDHSGELIEPETLEKAWYEYVESSRESNDMHEGPLTGTLVESVVFTPEKLATWGLAKDAMPVGAWVGFRVDQEQFDKVKAGQRRMFSIEGTAVREEVTV